MIRLLQERKTKILKIQGKTLYREKPLFAINAPTRKISRGNWVSWHDFTLDVPEARIQKIENTIELYELGANYDELSRISTF